MALPCGNRAISADSFQQQSRVLRTESDAVANRMLNLLPASNIGNVIEIAFGVGKLQVDGRRDLTVMHCDQRGGHPSGATGPLRMSNLRLQSRHRCGARSLPEGELQSPGFNAVIEL